LSNGAPVSGRGVNYQIMQGSGSLNPASALTNANGYASTNLNVSALSTEIHVSACVAPSNAPCQTFRIFAVPVSSLQLIALTGDQQIINTNQTFRSILLRVIDSGSPPNPVRGATVSLRNTVFRWEPTSSTTGPLLP